MADPDGQHGQAGALTTAVLPQPARARIPSCASCGKTTPGSGCGRPLDTAFGRLPASIDAQPFVLRGKPGKALTLVARQDGDLLVISAGHQSPLQKLAGCGVSRYCLAHADCPVLAIPPPPLAQEACYGLRGWAFRHRWIRAAAQPALAPIHHVNGPPGGSQARPRRVIPY